MTSRKTKSSFTLHRASQGNRDSHNRAKRSDQKNNPHSPSHTGLATAQPGITLKAGREKSLLRHHPWVFSGAIERVDGAPVSGDTLPVRSAQGEFLAWVAYNSDSQITARIWSWQEAEKIDADFFRTRILQALALRRDMKLTDASNGMRMIHAESDGLPGLVVDSYGDVLVMQIGSAGVERWRDTCADILQELCDPVCIYERSDSGSRALEGLPERNGVLRGALPFCVRCTQAIQCHIALCELQRFFRCIYGEH